MDVGLSKGGGGILSRLKNNIYFIHFLKCCIDLLQTGGFLLSLHGGPLLWIWSMFHRYSDISQSAWFGGRPHWMQILPDAAVCSERKPRCAGFLLAASAHPHPPQQDRRGILSELAYHQVQKHLNGILYSASVRVLFVTSNPNPTQTGLKKKEDILGPLTGEVHP